MTIGEQIAQFATDWAGRQVTSVTGSGTDWNGDTQSGFWSEFRVEFVGLDYRETIEGERLQEFWSYVMSQPVPDV